MRWQSFVHLMMLPMFTEDQQHSGQCCVICISFICFLFCLCSKYMLCLYHKQKNLRWPQAHQGLLKLTSTPIKEDPSSLYELLDFVGDAWLLRGKYQSRMKITLHFYTLVMDKEIKILIANVVKPYVMSNVVKPYRCNVERLN